MTVILDHSVRTVANIPDPSTPAPPPLDAWTDQASLVAALRFSTMTLPSRPGLPVFAGLIIEGVGDAVKLTAVDFAQQAEVIIPGSGVGRALVPGRQLLDLVKLLPKRSQVRLTLDGDAVRIDGGPVAYSVRVLPFDKYPAVVDFAGMAREWVTMTGADVASVADVAMASSTDGTLPVLCGVCLDVADGVARFQATDRYRMAEWTTTAATGAVGRVIIPTDAVKAVTRYMVKSATVTVSVVENQRNGKVHVIITDGARTVAAEAYPAEFPKVGALWPKATEHRVTLPVGTFLDGVKAVGAACEWSMPVRLTTGADTVVISTTGEATAETTVPASTDANLVIAFNPKYLADAVKSVAGKTGQAVVMAANEPKRPAVFSRDDRPDFRVLLMPVRLAG